MLIDLCLKYIYLLSALIFLFIGYFFHPTGIQNLREFNLFSYLGIFSKLLFFLTSILSWGGLILRYVYKVESCILLKIFWAIIFSVSIPMLFSMFGLYKIDNSIVFIFILFIGPVLYSLLVPGLNFNTCLCFKKLLKEKLFFSLCVWIIFYVILFLVIYKTFIPGNHTDPLYYALDFSLNIIEKGDPALNRHAVFNFLGTPWEYMNSWLIMLLDPREGFGSIESIIITQWSHVFIGLIPFIILLNKISFSDSLGPLKNTFFPILIILILGFTPLMDVTLAGKNDWGYILFTFYGLYFMTSIFGSQNLFLSGLSLGLAISIKSINLFFILPFISLYVVGIFLGKNKFKYVKIIKFIFGLLIFTFIKYYQNWSITGNPLFPHFSSIFHTDWMPISSDVLRHLILKPTPFWVVLFSYIKMIFIDVPFLYPLMFLLGFRIKYLTSFERKLYYSSLVAFLGYLSFSSANPALQIQLRFVSIPFIIFIYLGFREMGRITINTKLLKVFTGFLILLSISGSTFSTESFWGKFSLSNTTKYFWKRHMGADSKIWMLGNLPRNSIIVSSGENQFFTVRELKIFSVIDSSIGLELLKKYFNDYEELIRSLTALGVDYAYISNYEKYLNPFSEHLREFSSRYPDTILFSSYMGFVLDLKLLNYKISPFCYNSQYPNYLKFAELK